MTATLLLTRADLVGLRDPQAVVEAVGQGFRAYSAGGTETPIRIHLEVPGGGGVLLVMPCAVREPPTLGTKLATVFRANAARGLPTVASLYTLTDFDTGLPLALMDGTYLTALRTAAASAVATRALAREESAVLGIFGTGALAEAHLRVLPVVRHVQRALVVGRTLERARAFAERLAPDVAFPIEPAESAEALLGAADVVVTATTSREPLFDGRLARPGTHFNLTGAFTPTMREVDTELVRRSVVIADTRAGARAEAGDLLIPQREGAIGPGHLRAELGEVLLGRAPGRRSAEEITLFESVGAAFEDAVTARLAYERALRLEVGARFSFW